MKEYDQTFTQRLVGEVRATPQGSAIRQYFLDGTALRDAVRACRGVK